jgi:hypothetical protein
VEVEIANGPDVPSNAQALIQSAVSTVFAANARIGQRVYASSFVCAIAALGGWAKINLIEVNGGTSQAVGINQFPTLGAVVVTLV